MGIFWRYKLVIKIINSTVSSKYIDFQLWVWKVIVLASLAVSSERCVFHVDRVRTSTRGRGLAHVDRGGGQKSDFFVDVINGWPLNTRI